MPAAEFPLAHEDDSGLQPGSVVVGSIREVCLIRKIGAGGAVLHSDIPVEEGSCLELELDSGELLRGSIVWRHDRELGLRFDEPIDVLPILARHLAAQPGERRRMPRVEVSCAARLERGTRDLLVTMRDISQGGAKIESPVPLSLGERIVLTPEGLPPLAGSVRWVHDAAAGLVFESELDWQRLMPWLTARRDGQPGNGSSLPATADAVPPPGIGGEDGSIQFNLPARVREGARRWSIDVTTLTGRTVEFDCFAALRLGSLLWIVLPGLEGWPARIVAIEGYHFTCEFTQPLHAAVLERILASAKALES